MQALARGVAGELGGVGIRAASLREAIDVLDRIDQRCFDYFPRRDYALTVSDGELDARGARAPRSLRSACDVVLDV